MTAGVTTSVVAPASSANLGAGFDVFGMAVSLRAEVGVGPPPAGATAIEANHPGRIPFERLGGAGDLWFRTNIPMARGLGFSGALRAAAAGMGAVESASGDPAALDDAVGRILEVTVELEGHGDNVAASIAGGVAAFVDGRIVPFPVGPRLGSAAFIAWVPDVTTSTDASRLALSPSVDRDAAVANIGRAAQFALAFAHDDPALLADATDDRLHQGVRVPGVPGAADAIAAGVHAGAWCSWLSGSGPTVAMLCDAAVAEPVAASLPANGHTKILSIDTVGLRLS